MMPGRNLDDDYGCLLCEGPLDSILLDSTKRLRDKPDTMSADAKMTAVGQDLFEIHWGLYNVLGLL